MHGLTVIMLLGIVSESYSMYYSYKRHISPYLPSYRTLGGAGLGGAFGYGAGRYLGNENPWKAALLSALVSALATSGYRYFIPERPEEFGAIQNLLQLPIVPPQHEAVNIDIQGLTQRIGNNGIRAHMGGITPFFRIQGGLNTDLLFMLIPRIEKDTNEALLRNFNDALFDSVASENNNFVIVGNWPGPNAKIAFLLRLLTLYTKLESRDKQAFLDLGNRIYHTDINNIDDAINEVKNYLEYNNLFDKRGLFADPVIKGDDD